MVPVAGIPVYRYPLFDRAYSYLLPFCLATPKNICHARKTNRSMNAVNIQAVNIQAVRLSGSRAVRPCRKV